MTAGTNAAPDGISPGRAACEAFWAAVGAGPEGQEPGAAWRWASTQNTVTGWEAAAQAAIDADPRWPRCPDGCGCRLGTSDADRHDCACDGPCTAECRENGYPDAPSYRDQAVKHVMDERDEAVRQRGQVLDQIAAIAEARDEARAVVTEMCAHWERIGTTREEDELIPQWRERAGVAS